MAFVVTARKWRPQTFSEVVGQEHISTTLTNALANGRIAHAYMFTGPRGIGKTTTARILAKRLNCLNPKDGEPCNECEMCKDFMDNTILDVFEIDGASNRRIEEIRAIREAVKYTPAKGKFKIYIIDEVHMLTVESFNALLKTLEEPPEHVVFIFATTDIHKVPLTIISRCQRFDFRRVELKDTKNLLLKIATAEGIEIDDQSLTLIAKRADGALRDAQSLFDQVVSFCGNKITKELITEMLNLIDDQIYFNVSDAILNRDFTKVLEVSEAIYNNGWNLIDFLNGLIEHFRNFMVLRISRKTELIETSEVMKQLYLKYVDSFAESDLIRILTFINKTQYDIKNSANPKLKLEVALFQLVGIEKSSTITELINTIKEKGVIKNVVYNNTQQTVNLPLVAPIVAEPVIEPAKPKQKPNTSFNERQEFVEERDDDSPIVKAIIKELGGRELK
ncbi:MAG TPA: DNA polymerase III subunit gamma/tau [Melioribacteraceae bacterium]|nr:DNA polymerase III subunit gamma/tau [Melioribacteraceae bacterium]